MMSRTMPDNSTVHALRGMPPPSPCNCCRFRTIAISALIAPIAILAACRCPGDVTTRPQEASTRPQDAATRPQDATTRPNSATAPSEDAPIGAKQVLSETSPDGRFTAIAEMYALHSFPWPGPEPPRTTAQYHRLRVMAEGRTVFVLPWQNLGGSYGIGFFIDLQWSPKSERFAYRLVNELLVVEPQKKHVQRFSVEQPNSYISSFRWVDGDKLVVLTKKVAFHIDPYPTYIEETTGVDLWLLDLVHDRWQHVVSYPTRPVTYLFRSAIFRMDELSPFSSDVAFSDGTDMVIYDYGKRKSLLRVPVDASVEGVWWMDADRCLIAVNSLSGTPQFFRIVVSSGKTEEVTGQLKSLWNRKYDNLRWFDPNRP